MEKKSKELEILKALADETRLNIVKLLLDGEKCVCELFPFLKRTQSTTSLQLELLKNAGIIKSERRGRRVYYSISDKKIYKLLNILEIDKKKAIKKCPSSC